ncbi:MAG: LicD family protein [Clostridia bacterium]|nr:LicD family protein [Clostridia bacterium]
MNKTYKEAMSTLTSDKVRVITDEESRKLKKLLSDSLFEINEICKTNGITMFLCGGTLLGSIRHRGFIPWDDDLDVAMSREDYLKFVDIFEDCLGNKYELNAPNYCKDVITRFPKILIKNTVLKSIDNLEPHNQKIFIDVFIIDNVPENRLIRFIKGSLCQFFIGASSCVSVYKRDCSVARELLTDNALLAAYKKRIMIGRILSIKSLDWWLNKTDSICCYKKKTKSLGLPTGRFHYFGEIFPYDDFFPPKAGIFENNEFYIFNNYEQYLKNLYGDYMQIPPPEKRESHHITEIDFGDFLID